MKTVFLLGTVALCFPVIVNISGRAIAAPDEGAIVGKLSYPGDGIPALTVCAQSASNFKQLKCVQTKDNQRSYKLAVKPGKYHVFSYRPNGFQDFDTGKVMPIFIYHANWDTQTPILVQVSSGKTVNGIDLQNYNLCKSARPFCVAPSR